MELRTGVLSLLFFFSGVVTNDHVITASDCYCMDGGSALKESHSMSDDCHFRMYCSITLRFASGNGSDNFSVTAKADVPDQSNRHFKVRLTRVDGDKESPKVLIFIFTMNRLHTKNAEDIEYKFTNSLVERQTEKEVMNVCFPLRDRLEIQAFCHFTPGFDIRKHPVLVQVNDYHQIHDHSVLGIINKDKKFRTVLQSSNTTSAVILFSNGSKTLTTPTPATTTTEASVTSKPVVKDAGGEEPDTRLLFRLIWIQSFLLIILAVVYALILRVWWQARTRRRRREERKRRRSGSPVNQKKRSVSPKRRATASFESDAN